MATIILTGSCGDNATFNLYDNGLLEILGTGATRYYDNYVQVPWFEYRNDIKRITILEGITHIGTHLFENCYNVVSITLPDSIISIGDSAFCYCTGLTSVTIPDSVTSIGNYAFGSCAKLTRVTLKGQPPAMPYTTVFTNTPIADGTGRINVPRQYLDSYTSDTNWSVFKAAIHGVESLSDLFKKIAESIRGVSGKTDTIVAQYFPDEITNTADGIKTACNEVIVEKGGTEVANLSELPQAIENLPLRYKLVYNGEDMSEDYTGNEEIQEVELVNTTTISGSFQEMPNLEKFTFADTYAEDDYSVLWECPKLKELSTGGCTSFDFSALYDDFLKKYSLEVINFGKDMDVESIYVTGMGAVDIENFPNIKAYNVAEDNETMTSVNGVIYNKDVTELRYCPPALTSITIPDSVTSIGDDAFRGCTRLTNITIPDSVTSIGDDAFRGCTGLTSITIPDSVTSIGSYAFRGCTRLTSITIPNSVTSIGNYAFSGCTGLTSITIPNSVTSIGNYAFDGCTGLTSITIPNSVTSIGSYAFSGCTGLTSITIPDSVTTISYGAFYGCTGLTSITIPDSVTSIGNAAFQNCSNLKTVYYTGTLKQWCESAASTRGNSNPNYYADTLYINGEKIEGKVVIPDGTTKIKNYAFKNITAITEVVIPDSVTSIGSYAFRDCTGLTSVALGTGVSAINSYTFNGCTSLINLTLNKADTYVTLSNTSALTNTPIVTSTTEGYAYVPSALLEQYKAATNWATYANKIKAIGSE